jgi:hypothetical protein
MHDSRTEQSRRRVATWFDPEALLYGLVGLLVVVIGARQLAAWVANSWAQGQRMLVAGAFVVLAVAVGGFLFGLRRRRRWLVLGIALVAVGFVTYLLASLGFTLPPSWVQ